MIGPVTLWFEITQYNDKRLISIAKLVETTWMSRHPRPTRIGIYWSWVQKIPN